MAAALMNSPAIGGVGGAGGAGKFEFLRFFGCKFKLPMIHAQWVPRPPVTRPSSPRSSPTSNRGTSWTGTAPLGNEAEFELWTVQSGASTCSEGFVTSFLRLPPGRCYAAQASKGNFQKTYYKTFGTSCRLKLYFGGNLKLFS